MSQHQRLVLMTPVCSSAQDLLPALQAALAAGRVDAVIVRLGEGDDRSLINIVKALGPCVQDAGAALLLQDHLHLVARSGADGVHLSSAAACAEAMALLRPQERIVGCGGLRSRHDAMEVAEAGCDYVMFGEPFADGGHLPLSATLERGQWWAELFQTPCVLYVQDLADLQAASATGSEFLALGASLFADPDQAANGVRQALEIITAPDGDQRISTRS